MQKITTSEQNTKRFAAETIAKLEGLEHKKGAFVIALEGDLGAGKTTFVKGVAEELGVKHSVTSPTFLIMRSYKTKNETWPVLVHIDAYRIEDPEELRSLGFDDLKKDPKKLILVEWADKVAPLVPDNAAWVRFEHGSAENRRAISLELPK